MNKGERLYFRVALSLTRGHSSELARGRVRDQRNYTLGGITDIKRFATSKPQETGKRLGMKEGSF